MQQSEYAGAGVNYQDIEPFKAAMIAAGRRTLEFPLRRRQVLVVPEAHGCTYEYVGQLRHRWALTKEGLGNKNWIAELLYEITGDPGCFVGIAIDNALMAVNDVIAQGALPAVYADEVCAGDSEWFKDEARAAAIGEGFYQVCSETGMALAAGESPSCRYLVKAEPPVKSAPLFSGCVTGIIAPHTRRIDAKRLAQGDVIIGVPSTGLHANGVSLVIKRAGTLPEGFVTRLSTDRTLADEALIPTRSYVGFVEALLEADVDVHALLPGTGSGVAKIAFDKREFTYRIDTWVPVPPLFEFMRSIGVSLMDCLTTFNWGIGYYCFVAEHDADRVLELGRDAGYDPVAVGRVEKGKREVVFEPEDIVLPPPGE